MPPGDRIVFVSWWNGYLDLSAVGAADLGAPTFRFGLKLFNSIGLVDDHTAPATCPLPKAVYRVASSHKILAKWLI